LSGLLERGGHAVRRVGRLADAPAACEDAGPFDLVVSPADEPDLSALARIRDVALRCGAAGIAVGGMTVAGGPGEGAGAADTAGWILPRVWEDVVAALREVKAAAAGVEPE